jgi:hypothetical protein
MKKTTLLIIAFVGVIQASLLGQSVTVSGIIHDETSQPLVNATCVAISASDSTFLKFSLTDMNGKFQLKDIKPQEILLQVTFLGYNQYAKRIDLTANQNDLDVGTISLLRSENKLDEVVIKGETTPIEVRKDTLVYNANAFETTPNEVVEDLLRKMPGIEVEDDGTIIAQGEEVEKVTVDGKDFFGNDPKAATKNLPAQSIDKVEFFNRQSDMSEFTGVDDGERIKTMNLELKEDYKKGQFGTLAGAYGTDDRYETRLSLNRYTPKLQTSVIGNFNNVNRQGFSTQEYRNFMGSMGGFRNRGAGGVPINSGLSDGFVSTAAGGLNLNYEFSPKTKINLSYFLNDINNQIESITTRENFINERPSFFTNETSNQVGDNTNHKVEMRLDHKIDSTQDIRITSSLSFNNANLSSLGTSNLVSQNIIENQGSSDYLTDGTGNSLEGGLMYRKKLGVKKNKSLTLNLNLNSSDEDFNADLGSLNEFFPEDPVRSFSEDIMQRQLQTDDQMSYQVRTSYVQPITNGKYFEILYRRQNFDNELVRDVYDAVLNGEEFNDLLSNHYDRNFVYDRGGIALHHNGESSSLSLEAQLQYSQLSGDIISENVMINKTGTYFLPRLSWRKELGTSHFVDMRYSTNVSEPSIQQLQPIIDNSDPLSLYQGNPDLTNEYRHNLRINYIKFDQFSFSSLFAFINASYTSNNITNETIIDDAFRRITRPVNVDYDFSVNGNITYATPIRKFGMKVRLNTNLRYQNSILFINSEKNKADRYTTRFGVTLENRSKKVIDVSVGGNWSYNLTSYDVNSDRNQSFLNQTYTTDLILKPNGNWIFNSSLRYRIISNNNFGESQQIPIVNASISRFVNASKKLELKVSVFDLLNQNVGINQTVNLNYIENEEILSLGRYFLVGLTYAIRGTSAGDEGGRGMMRGMRR